MLILPHNFKIGFIVDANGSVKVPLPALYKSRPIPTPQLIPPVTHHAKQQRKTAHNVTEKKYRNSINQSIDNLKASVPALNAPEVSEQAALAAKRRKKQSKKKQAQSGKEEEDSEDDSSNDLNILVDGVKVATKDNKATVIRKATEYIAVLKIDRENQALENDRLRKENAALHDILAKLMREGSVGSSFISNGDYNMIQETSPPHSGGAASPSSSSSEPMTPNASGSSDTRNSRGPDANPLTSSAVKFFGVAAVLSWASFWGVSNHETHAPGKVLGGTLLPKANGNTMIENTTWAWVSLVLLCLVVYTWWSSLFRNDDRIKYNSKRGESNVKEEVKQTESVATSIATLIQESPQKAYQVAARAVHLPSVGLPVFIGWEWLKWATAFHGWWSFWTMTLPSMITSCFVSNCASHVLPSQDMEEYQTDLACMLVEADLAGGMYAPKIPCFHKTAPCDKSNLHNMVGNPSSTFMSRLYITMKALNGLYHRKAPQASKNYLVCGLSLKSLARRLPQASFIHHYLTSRAARCIHVAVASSASASSPIITHNTACTADFQEFVDTYFAARAAESPISVDAFATAYRHHRLLKIVSLAWPHLINHDAHNSNLGKLTAEKALELANSLACLLKQATMAQDADISILCYLIGGMTGVFSNSIEGLEAAVDHYRKRHPSLIDSAAVATALCGFSAAMASAKGVELLNQLEGLRDHNGESSDRYMSQLEFQLNETKARIMSSCETVEEAALLILSSKCGSSSVSPVLNTNVVGNSVNIKNIVDAVSILLGMFWCLSSRDGLINEGMESHPGCALLIKAMKNAVRHVSLDCVVESVKSWEERVRGD